MKKDKELLKKLYIQTQLLNQVFDEIIKENKLASPTKEKVEEFMVNANKMADELFKDV